jgi:hypothetical protein
MNNKIGVGVITCDRQEFFEKCINSIPEVNTLVVVNDGKTYPNSAYPSKIKEVIQHSTNKSVGVSKNEVLRYLIQDGCEHLFLIEDDMLIKNNDVFEKYINTAKTTGIYHFNYFAHGPANFKPNQYGIPNPRQIIDYGNDVKIGLYPNCVGAFSYYLKGVIKNVGYMDEHLINCWEHVMHTYEIIKKGLHPPFWYFADVYNSIDYIQEQCSSELNSTIRKTPEWRKNFYIGMERFKQKHGYYPTEIPDTHFNDVKNILKNIHTNYALNSK